MSEKKPDQQRISSVPPFGLRMLPELRQQVEEAAEQNGRSMNAEIIARLQWSFEAIQVTEVGKETRPMSADDYNRAMSAVVERVDKVVAEMREQIDRLKLRPTPNGSEDEN